MPAPTSLEVAVDAVEYSRYEPTRDTITATVTVSGGAPYSVEPIVVELIKARRSRDAVVATSTLEFTTYEDPTQGEVTFYLPDIVDQDLISLVRHGKYFVRATHEASSLEAETDNFDIRIVTVEEFKSKYLFGLNLQATNVLLPKFQPVAMPVRIAEVSEGHPQGFFTLTYNFHREDTADATATIGSGANGTVTVTAVGDFTGDLGNSLGIEVVVPSGTAGLSATLTGTLLTVSLAVNAGVPVPAANTATLVAAAIDALAAFTATASGTGADSLSTAEAAKSFTGGTSTRVRQLSWDGGPSVSIPTTGTYILRKGSSGPFGDKVKRLSGSTAYAVVKVGSLLSLPTTTVAEDVLIEQAKMDDDSLGGFLDQAVTWLEQDELNVHVEPTNVVTDRDPTTVQYAAGINAPAPLFTDTDYDFLVSPLTYYLSGTGGQSWIFIQTPYNSILRVDNLFGSIANTRVIDIDLEWIEHSQEGGIIQLVPFNQEIAFDFVGLIWSNSLRGSAELPNFWHFNMIVGLRDATADIREIIAKKAAVDALTIAAQAFRPGVGSISLGRDGVSESVSYTAQAQFGLYTGQISQYKDQLEKQLPKLKARYKGINFRVV